MHLKAIRSRLSLSDASIVLGMVLLILSMGGLYFDTSNVDASTFDVSSRQPGEEKVIRKVNGLPTRVSQPAALPVQATPTPFQPQINSPAAETNDNSFLIPGTPLPTEFPPLEKLAPDRIVIPAIQLDAVVMPAGYELVEVEGQIYQQWDAPNQYAAGWQQTSAFLGVPGNTILYGHHNEYGSVFSHLKDLVEGDVIQVYSGQWVFSYTVTNKMILPERGEPLSVRLDNARWILPTSDERLTLVTCWPPDNNTHRVFIVASPEGKRLANAGVGQP